MWLTSLEATGLRDPLPSQDLSRMAALPAPPGGTLVADALGLWVAGLHAGSTARELTRLGFAGDASTYDRQDGMPGTVEGLAPDATRALLAAGERQVVVEVGLRLDPPLYGRLRQRAIREPWLVDALSAGADLGVKVGWMVTTDHTVASPSVLRLTLGDTPLRPPGGEEPAWLGAVLAEIAGRVCRLGAGDPLSRLEAASRAPDALVPARLLGPAASEAIALVTAVHVDAPDVLVVESPSAPAGVEAAVGWLEARTQGDDAPLEQVLWVPAAGSAA